MAAVGSLGGPISALLSLAGLQRLQGLGVAIVIILSVFSVPLGVSALRLGFRRWRFVGGVGAVLGAMVWSWFACMYLVLSYPEFSRSPELTLFALSVPIAWSAVLAAALFRTSSLRWTVLSMGLAWPLAFIVMDAVVASAA